MERRFLVCKTRSAVFGRLQSACRSIHVEQFRGGVELNVAPQPDLDGRNGSDVSPPPTPEQARAFQLLLDNEPNIGRSVLHAIFIDYPVLRNNYFYDDPEFADIMPAIERSEQLTKLIGLKSVDVLSLADDGVAYINFDFSCLWDEQEGLSVLTHQNRVIGVGSVEETLGPIVAAQVSMGGRRTALPRAD